MSRRRGLRITAGAEQFILKDIGPCALQPDLLHVCRVVRHLAILEAAVVDLDVSRAACGQIRQWSLLGVGDAALFCVPVGERVRYVGVRERADRAVGCGGRSERDADAFFGGCDDLLRFRAIFKFDVRFSLY